MAAPINLRQARKALGRKAKDQAASEARAKHGETKAAREKREAQSAKTRAEIDGHKRDEPS